MSKTASLVVQINITGDGLIYTRSQGAIPNTNTPPPVEILVANGNNTVAFPTTGTFTAIAIYPPANSMVSKYIKGIGGDTGIGPFTSLPVVVPASPGGSMVINANGSETLEGAFS